MERPKRLLLDSPPPKNLNVGDEFWEVQNGVAFPRWAHSASHVVYCMKNLGKTTFLSKEDAQEAGYPVY